MESPSLFNLAATTHFDLESFVFCFAMGGIASVLYEAVFPVEHRKLTKEEVLRERRSLHMLAIVSPFLVFLVLQLSTGMNPIYSVSAAMLFGGIMTIICRRDLVKKVLIGGLMFAALYSAFFICIALLFPQFVKAWNFAAITGVILVNMPLE